MARLYGPGPEPPPPLIVTSDLSGLSTSDVDGRPVGELVGAISEERSGLIRYLDVDVRSADRHVLVPIGHARIVGDAVPPGVRLRAATYEDLLAVPAFTETDPLDGAFQERVMAAHGRLFYGSRYYAHPSYDHSALAVGESPVVAESGRRQDDVEPGLRPLAELTGFRLRRSAPDLAGWQVVDCEGEEVGEVEDLLVETPTGRARYVVIDLAELGRRTALPLGYVETHDAERVHLSTLSESDLWLLPPYEPPLTRAGENRILAALESRLTGDRYFDRPDFRRSPADPTP